MATSFKQPKNNAQSTLGEDLDTTETGIDVASGHGSRFPAPGNGFYATIWNSGTYADPFSDPNMEIVLVSARTTDTLTVTRGQLGTSGVAHTTGDDIRLLVDASFISDLNTAVNALEALPAKTITSDTTTSIGASSDFTLSVAIGSNRGFVLFYALGASTTFPGVLCVATTTATDARAAEIAGGSTTMTTGNNTYLTQNSTNAFGTSIKLKSARINGTNLDLIFSNTDGGGAHTLSAYVAAWAFGQ